MKRMFIDQLDVTGVGCVRNLSARLTPLHAFIGPNDSGKSTLLRAIQSVFIRARRDQRESRDLDQYSAGTDMEQSVAFMLTPDDYRAEFKINRGEGNAQLSVEAGESKWSDCYLETQEWLPGPSMTLGCDAVIPAYDWLQRGARFIRWEADALRRPSALIPDRSDAQLSDERGGGLAGVYDLIFNRGDDVRDRIQDNLRGLFPTVRSLRLSNVSDREKALELQLTSGAIVAAATMSEGMLYYLAYAATQYLKPAAILLVEEPENGLHPARITDVVSILREISKVTQVVVATHSPLLVNELAPEEVTVITRDPEEGSQARALQDTPNFEERRKVYALGELWLSYANGEDEAPLLGADDGEE